MYIIEQRQKFEKGHKQAILERYQKPFILQKVDGFVKREVLINETNKDFDSIIVKVYFESREAYIKWEGSDLHRSMHAGPKESKPITPGLMEVTRTSYHELVTVYKTKA